VTDEGMRAVRSVAGLTCKKTTRRSWVEQMELAASSPSTCRSCCEVRRAAEGGVGPRLSEMPNLADPLVSRAPLVM
jgi:hypothetical protein